MLLPTSDRPVVHDSSGPTQDRVTNDTVKLTNFAEFSSTHRRELLNSRGESAKSRQLNYMKQRELGLTFIGSERNIFDFSGQRTFRFSQFGFFASLGGFSISD